MRILQNNELKSSTYHTFFILVILCYKTANIEILFYNAFFGELLDCEDGDTGSCLKWYLFHTCHGLESESKSKRPCNRMKFVMLSFKGVLLEK